ncbi:hypothetical protein ACFPM0_07980 [Pseudonocardia sulfidoxydans]|uniref:hypothetical protein n=1 Tax=Pseudonocardia sulfidoxydans TaxID=54011 RepID=UPI00360E7E3C
MSGDSRHGDYRRSRPLVARYGATQCRRTAARNLTAVSAVEEDRRVARRGHAGRRPDAHGSSAQPVTRTTTCSSATV